MNHIPTRPLEVDTVHTRVFLEGVLFPYVESIRVNDTPNSISCTLTMPPSVKLRPEELVGATLHIFYANRRVLKQGNKFGSNDTRKPSKWPILFQGELAADGEQTMQSSRRQQLRFVSHGRHWDQTQVFHLNPGRDLRTVEDTAAKQAALFMGNTNFTLEASGAGLSKHTQIWSRLSKIEDMFDTEGGRNMAYTSMVLELVKMVRDVHPIFRVFDERLRLSNRFAAFSDPDVYKILPTDKLKQVIDGRVKELHSETSLMVLLNMVLSMLKYEWNHMSQPLLRTNALEHLEKMKNLNARVSTIMNKWDRDLSSSVDAGIAAVADLAGVDFDPSEDGLAVGAGSYYTKYTEKDTKAILDEAQQKLGYRDELNEFAVTPTMEFSSPPVCNVFLPTNMNSYGINRNFMQEITRLIGKVKFGPGAKNAVPEWYVAPTSQSFFSLKGTSLTKFTAGHQEYRNRFVRDKGVETERGSEGGIDTEAAPNTEGMTDDEIVNKNARGEMWQGPIAPGEEGGRQGYVTSADHVIEFTPEAEKIAVKHFKGKLPDNPKPNKQCTRWVSHIELWRRRLGISASDLPTEVVLTVMQIESSGKTRPARTGRHWGLMQQYSGHLKDAYEHIVERGGIEENAKEKYRKWFGLNVARKMRTEELRSPAGDLYSNLHAHRSIGTSLAYWKRYKSYHDWRPDLVALCHKYPVDANKYRRLKETKGSNKARDWFTKRGREKPDNVAYAYKFQRYHRVWKGEDLPKVPDFIYETGSFFETKSAEAVGTMSDVLNITTKQTVTPFTINQMVTPEEMRRGIVAQYFTINDWTLNTLPSEDAKRERSDANEEDTGGNQDDQWWRSDTSQEARKRYVNSLVDAEFYRRRFRARQVNAVTGGFNPYPVTGFPGLIMAPDRPILGYVSSVTHSINVASAQGSTTAQLQAPRYWDEGEVWHWMGGWSQSDLEQMGVWDAENPALFQRFPFWHNRVVVPQNSVAIPQLEAEESAGAANQARGERYSGGSDKTTEETRAGLLGSKMRSKITSMLDKGDIDRRITPLDEFYQFMIGCDAVDYLSNHADPSILSEDNIIDLLVERQAPEGFELHPQTLAPREYNRLIADTVTQSDVEDSDALKSDDVGKFMPGTLAFEFWGFRRPYSIPETEEAPLEKAQAYNERYGVKEDELMIEFLGNKPHTVRGRLVYVGKTFHTEPEVSLMQKQILDYIDDLKRRDIGGGVG